jgi:endonuclease-3
MPSAAKKARRRAAKPSRRESAGARAARALAIVERLKAMYPGADCALAHRNPLELLVATILSAQCTDKRVNMVTPDLFARYPSAEAFARAPRRELEERIRSTGFFRSKAKAIQEACREIHERHGGEVPRTLEELVQLRGIGRKTANVVLGNAYGVPGIVVDTHVKRIANRLRLTRNHDPVKIERDLMPLVPEPDWVFFSHAVILHGRGPCKARKPACGECKLSELCPSAQMG